MYHPVATPSSHALGLALGQLYPYSGETLGWHSRSVGSNEDRLQIVGPRRKCVRQPCEVSLVEERARAAWFGLKRRVKICCYCLRIVGPHRMWVVQARDVPLGEELLLLAVIRTVGCMEIHFQRLTLAGLQRHYFEPFGKRHRLASTG